jgi:lipopolysaccharide biosynthesis regulator YciM
VIADVLYGLVALLLPIAAGSGYFFGRRALVAQKARRPAINEILFKDLAPGSGKRDPSPDKVLDLLIHFLEVESDSADTHLALGDLYRMRGEISRAIRLHQTMAGGLSLPMEQRQRAQLELGMDYLRSGLLDRAEEVFRTLFDGGVFPRQALTQLLELYQQERDWDKALLCALRLESETGEPHGVIRAHLLCEKAGEQLVRKEHTLASSLLAEALAADPRCVRASLMAGDLAYRAGIIEDAVRHYRHVEGQDADFLPEAIEPLVAACRARGSVAELKPYLQDLACRYQGATPVLALASILAEEGLRAEAVRCLEEALRRRPSLRLLDRLVEYTLEAAIEPTRSVLLLLKEYTGRVADSRIHYRCVSCGFAGRFLHWQCPGCKSWGKVKPVRGIEGE